MGQVDVFNGGEAMESFTEKVTLEQNFEEERKPCGLEAQCRQARCPVGNMLGIHFAQKNKVNMAGVKECWGEW